MVDDLGGVETLSAGQQQLIKRCAMISVACREPIDVTPALTEYLDALPAETQDVIAAASADEGEN